MPDVAPYSNTEPLEWEAVGPEHLEALKGFYFYAMEHLNARARAIVPMDETTALERIRRNWNKTARNIKGEATDDE